MVNDLTQNEHLVALGKQPFRDSSASLSASGNPAIESLSSNGEGSPSVRKRQMVFLQTPLLETKFADFAECAVVLHYLCRSLGNFPYCESHKFKAIPGLKPLRMVLLEIYTRPREGENSVELGKLRSVLRLWVMATLIPLDASKFIDYVLGR